ncbi:MAG: DUF4011 domain-containing protein [Nitrospira sp. CG24E]|nr:MAG: DUF4011 domain-containing protein [Nitrospira sp. CG24E]
MSEPTPREANQPDFSRIVHDGIERLRSRLLDLSLGNRLLNYKHSDKSRTHVRIIDEVPEILIDKLDQGRQLTFAWIEEPESELADEQTFEFRAALRQAKESEALYIEQKQALGRRPSDRQLARIERALRDRLRTKLGMAARIERTVADRARELGINPSYDLPEPNGTLPRRHTDMKVQTLHYREQMETKLAAIRDGDRTLLQDAGINALHCAFGFVEWYETPESETALYAPLLFYPVEIAQKLQGGRYTYVLDSRDGDIEPNTTLGELLRRQFGLELPEWESEEQELSEYFLKVIKVISRERRWKLRRWATVGLFTFSKLAMYRDLDSKNWSGDRALTGHPILQDLLMGSESVTESALAPEYPIDSQPVTQTTPSLVTDADSSQHSVVIDVLKGKNLVVQGPPGTGKSQTITNFIAAALGEGKNVLFVAEKMAALEVVKKRLDNFGLGHFCLELHSSKTRKSNVLQSLKERSDFSGPRHNATQLRQLRQACEEAKSALMHYVERMKESVGETGLTVQEVLLKNCTFVSSTRDFPRELRQVRIEKSHQMGEFSRRELKQLASGLQEKSAAITNWGSQSHHPWRGLQNDQLDLFRFDELTTILRDWSQSLQAIQEAISQAVAQTGWPTGYCRRDLIPFLEAARSISGLPDEFAEDVFRKMKSPSDCTRLEKLVAGIQEIAELCSEIDRLGMNRDLLLRAGSSFLREVVKEARELGLREVRVPDIKRATEDARQQAVAWEEAHSIGEKLSALFAATENSPPALSIMATGVSLLQELPRSTLRFRVPEVINEDNLPTLEEAVRQREQLLQEKTRLSETIETSLLPSLEEIKSAARELKSAGFFRRLFSREYRRARQLYYSLAKDGRRVNGFEAGRILTDLANVLEQIQTFESDARFSIVAGSFYRGKNTPWKELVTITRWAQKVRQALPSQLSDWAHHVRNHLLSADISRLEDVLAFAETSEWDRFRNALQLLEGSSASSFQTAASRERQRESALTTLLQNLTTIGVGLLNSVADLDHLPEAVGRIEDVKNRLLGCDIGSFITGDELYWIKELPRLQYTLEFARKLIEAGVQEPAWQVLVNGDIAHGLSKLNEHAGIISDRLGAALTHQGLAWSLGRLDSYLWTGSKNFSDTSFDKLQRRAALAAEHIDALPTYLDFLRVENQAKSSLLAPILKAFTDAESDYIRLEEVFEFVFYRSVAETLLHEDPQLNSHSGSTHEQLRNRFQQYDREILKLQRQEIASKLRTREVDPGVSRGRASDRTGLALLMHQMTLQRRHMPLRGLFKRAGKAIQSLKPCFLMSPMSVAQFLEPGSLQFDLVVMDEASQIRPEDAIGAIGRGSQLVIVGDPLQLPPTSFFQRVDSDGALDDEDENSQDLTGQESILDMARSVYQPVRQLRWHYRSQHEKLIAFSNHEFYNDSLIVFPSPKGNDANFGVGVVEVDGVYEASQNRIEAEAVVDAAQKFMHQHPDRSLGIVAMNQPQRELINTMMDENVFPVDPEAAAYRTRWEKTLEPFFVKNLENVQGDERDVIYISTVYGKDPSGAFHRRFGPINGTYGHRRLNVLFTRSKQQIRLFTSIDASLPWGPPEDMRWGARVFKNYLQFAREGHLEFARTTGREPDSDFERWVIQLLREKGYEVVPQLGVAGYFIDLAVCHPNRSGSFILGVECDGATYHSARSVRDRDRLRQEILEKLNWKIYRIWSTDWFRNPQSEFQKLVDSIERLRGASHP